MFGILGVLVLGPVFFGLFIASFLYTIYKIINKESGAKPMIIITGLFSTSVFSLFCTIIRSV